MLWSRGEIVADEALSSERADRTFEHGLGLFETFRTWNGHPTLLDRHLERLQRSPAPAWLPLDASQLPDARAVAELVAASRDVVATGHDARLRITLSGGLATTPATDSLALDDGRPPAPFATPTGCKYHGGRSKSSGKIHWPATRRSTTGDDESRTPKQLRPDPTRPCASRTMASFARRLDSNIFLIEGNRLFTPNLDGPLLPGIMRQVVLERAAHAGVEIYETALPIQQVQSADEAFLTNSVLGVFPIAQLMDTPLPAPGAATRRLWNDILAWLESGGLSIQTRRFVIIPPSSPPASPAH